MPRRVAAACVLPWLLAGVSACGTTRHGYAAVNPAQVDPADVLVVGRVRIFYDGEDVTGRTVLRTSPEYRYRLPPDGSVSWLVRRPVEPMYFDAAQVQGDDGGLVELGEHRVPFVPHDVDARMIYVGDIVVVIGQLPRQDLDIELQKRNRMLRIGRADRADRVLGELAKENERIAGAQYYHVMRRARAKAPQSSP